MKIGAHTTHITKKIRNSMSLNHRIENTTQHSAGIAMSRRTHGRKKASAAGRSKARIEKHSPTMNETTIDTTIRATVTKASYPDKPRSASMMRSQFGTANVGAKYDAICHPT